MAKKKIKFKTDNYKFSDKDILAEDEFDPKHGKERITILVDQQVVDAFRARAAAQGEKYQALMREALRESIFGNDIIKRLEALEKKVG